MGMIWKDRRGKSDMSKDERIAVMDRMTVEQRRLGEEASRVEVVGDFITFFNSQSKVIAKGNLSERTRR